MRTPDEAGIIDLATIRRQKAEADEPAMTGQARCLDCRHEWTAVAPIGARWLECPACGLGKGQFVKPIYPDEVWTCACGNDLFVLGRNNIFCPVCGSPQHPY